MKRKITALLVLSITALLIYAASTVSAEEYASMKGIKTAKAVFDERQSIPISAALNLSVIHQTYKDFKAMNKNPVFVIVFTGPSVKLISRNREGFSAEDQKYLDEIVNTISAMSKDGIKLEICLVAARIFNIEPASVLPEIKRVGNGWISIIGYEAKRYALVPVY